MTMQTAAHVDFLKLPRARILKRASRQGARIYYVWDGRSRGLGEVVLGRDPVLAIELWHRHEADGGIASEQTPQRLASAKYRLRPNDDPYKQLPKWARHLYLAAETRAKNSGRRFTLTPAELMELVRRAGGRCEVSGATLNTEPSRNGRPPPFGPSLDRLDSSDGYTMENCRIVCLIVNFAMNTWGEEPLRQLVNAMNSA